MSRLIAIVMAAGQGTRMKSVLPKVLHSVCGRPLVYYPIKAALELGAEQIVVVANPKTRDAIESTLASHLPAESFTVALQETPRGTGDAVRAGINVLELRDDDQILILSGDTPLISCADLAPLRESFGTNETLSFLYFRATDPYGYGRVIRDTKGAPVAIIEQRDLAPGQQSIDHVNAGVYLVRAKQLKLALCGLTNKNVQNEFYLTDIVASLAKYAQVQAIEAGAEALAGVNDRSQLNAVEQVIFQRIRMHWARQGVTIVGMPLIDHTVVLGIDARIEDGVRLRGATSIGSGTLVDVGTVVSDAEIGQDSVIKPYCVIAESRIGAGVQLGPFAHLRPGSVLEDEVHVGNYVETKNTLIKRGAKANHLAYLGDAEIGERSNLGAGTIICNYNGYQKQRTIVGREVFIGSDSQLIAPLKIGDYAYVATGTTVAQDVPEGALAIGRVRQSNKEGYAHKLRDRLRALATLAKAKK